MCVRMFLAGSIYQKMKEKNPKAKSDIFKNRISNNSIIFCGELLTVHSHNEAW